MQALRLALCGALLTLLVPTAGWAASVEFDCPTNPGVVRFWIDYDSNAIKYAFYSGNGSIYSRGDGENIEITHDGIAVRAGAANFGINRLTGQFHTYNGSYNYEGTCTPGDTPFPEPPPPPPQKF